MAGITSSAAGAARASVGASRLMSLLMESKLYLETWAEGDGEHDDLEPWLMSLGGDIPVLVADLLNLERDLLAPNAYAEFFNHSAKKLEQWLIVLDYIQAPEPLVRRVVGLLSMRYADKPSMPLGSEKVRIGPKTEGLWAHLHAGLVQNIKSVDITWRQLHELYRAQFQSLKRCPSLALRAAVNVDDSAAFVHTMRKLAVSRSPFGYSSLAKLVCIANALECTKALLSMSELVPEITIEGRHEMLLKSCIGTDSRAVFSAVIEWRPITFKRLGQCMMKSDSAPTESTLRAICDFFCGCGEGGASSGAAAAPSAAASEHEHARVHHHALMEMSDWGSAGFFLHLLDLKSLVRILRWFHLHAVPFQGQFPVSPTLVHDLLMRCAKEFLSASGDTDLHLLMSSSPGMHSSLVGTAAGDALAAIAILQEQHTAEWAELCLNVLRSAALQWRASHIHLLANTAFDFHAAVFHASAYQLWDRMHDWKDAASIEYLFAFCRGAPAGNEFHYGTTSFVSRAVKNGRLDVLHTVWRIVCACGRAGARACFLQDGVHAAVCYGKIAALQWLHEIVRPSCEWIAEGAANLPELVAKATQQLDLQTLLQMLEWLNAEVALAFTWYSGADDKFTAMVRDLITHKDAAVPILEWFHAHVQHAKTWTAAPAVIAARLNAPAILAWCAKRRTRDLLESPDHVLLQCRSDECVALVDPFLSCSHRDNLLCLWRSRGGATRVPAHYDQVFNPTVHGWCKRQVTSIATASAASGAVPPHCHGVTA